MDVEVRFATTEEEREAIYRLRYATYVQEIHLYSRQADHERSWLKDPDDESVRLMYATVGQEIVGTLRMHLGGEGSLSEALTTRFELAPFLALLPPERLC